MRILAIAYACDPRRGSEEGVGWGWVRMIAGLAQVDVITADFQRAGVAQGGLAGVHFHYVQPRPWHYRPDDRWRRIEASAAKPLMNLAYQGWLGAAARLARDLCTRHRYDLVHLITYVGFRFPGRFYRLGVPFVWGPIGGLENTPWRFLGVMGWDGALFFAGRNLINTAQKALLPGPRQAMRVAGARGGLIAATAGIKREIAHWYGQRSTVICEIGPPADCAADCAQRAPGAPLQIAWSGQHLPGKALPLLLRGLAGLAPDRLDWRLTVMGTGPLTGKWQALAQRLGIDDRIEWTGQLPRALAVRRMHAAHVFAITSLKDLTSTVLLEALSQGVPVVCPDHCGFANVVDASCGVKVPLQTPAQLARDLAAAIAALGADEPHRRALARGALVRTEAFSWARKADRLAAIYREVLGRR